MGIIWNGYKEGKKIQVQNEWETKLKPKEKMDEFGMMKKEENWE